MVRLKTDYCTCFPERLFGVYIGDICLDHDWAYEGENKFRADWKLRRKIRKRFKMHGMPVIGKVVSSVMWLGVSTFGWIHYRGRG